MKNKKDRKMGRILLPAAVLQLFAGLLWAGPTAHISGPSEDFQGYLDPALTVAVNLAEEKDASGARPATLTGLGVVMGFLPGPRLNGEAGFDYKACGDPADDNPVYFNAKLGFPEGALGGGAPAVVGGIFDAGTSAARTAFNVYYAEAAKSVELGGLDLGKFTAGWFRGNSALLTGPDGGKDNNGLIAAWDRTMTEVSDKLWVSADYLGTKSVYGSFNFGVAWKFNSKVSAILGYNIFNNKKLVNTYNVQLTLGLGADAK